MIPLRSTGFAHAAEYHCKKKKSEEKAGGIKNIQVICNEGRLQTLCKVSFLLRFGFVSDASREMPHLSLQKLRYKLYYT